MGEIKKIVTENEELKRHTERLKAENEGLKQQILELQSRIETMQCVETCLRREISNRG